MLLSCRTSSTEPRCAVPSGEEMVEERGVPVHEDWSMAPDDDRVRFSLSGVAPHSWRKSPWWGWGIFGKDGSVSPRHPYGWQKIQEGQTPAIPSPQNLLPAPCASARRQHVSESSHLLAPGWGSPGHPQFRLSP